MPKWDAFEPPDTFRRIGEGMWAGPCPVTGEGRDGFFITPAKRAFGCRKCSPGSGSLSSDDWKAHAVALGIWETREDGWQPTPEQRRRHADRKRAEAEREASIDRMMDAAVFRPAPIRPREHRGPIRWSLEGQCPECGGTGYARCGSCGGRRGVECRDCGSLGRLWCRRCGGRGY